MTAHGDDCERDRVRNAPWMDAVLEEIETWNEEELQALRDFLAPPARSRWRWLFYGGSRRNAASFYSFSRVY